MEVEVDGSRSKTGSQPRVKADGGGHATLPACLRTFIFNLLFLGRLVCQCFCSSGPCYGTLGESRRVGL